PGQKILLRGNHDYWWSSITKVRSVLPPTMYALQNDALLLDGHVFCGTRGWALPTMYYPLGEEDRKVFERELIRLELSLDAAAKLRDRASVTVMMHFPPLLADGMSTAFTKLLEARGVQRVVYGHLHGAGIKNGFIGKRNGIDYFLVSCDAVQFSPMCIIEEEGPPYL
ncbi:MAG: phosphohydrolase, partial [Clostridiales bacterium]|nr:phosphohydrolase [Clostridiales bacterium]